MMKHLPIYFLIFTTLFCKTKLETSDSEEKGLPNIVIIMSDDMGYSDISPFGGEIDTPNLSKMANNGLRFGQFYNNARCCPTRASLMTGVYPHRAGIGHMTNPPNDATMHNYGTKEYQGYLSKNTVTLAEVLKEAGYATLMSGKWHLGAHKKEMWPLQRGFEKFYGIIAGAANHFQPKHPRGITRGNNPEDVSDDYYSSDAFTSEAINFISESKNKHPEKPFFLYLSYTAPHWPIQAPKEVVDKYKERYCEGWQTLRLERYERMKEMGIIDSGWPLTAQDSPDWDTLLDKEKQEEMNLRMAIYAAMVDRMDQNIGRLMSELKNQGELENTLVLFLNDNGACAEFSELGDGPASQLETEKGYALTYGRAWANASNTPYRKYKHWLHEGGIATPFIVQWPAGIDKSLEGAFVHSTYGFLPDLMATCLDLAKVEYPKTYNGYPIEPHVGKSLVPVFTDTTHKVHHEPIFWEHEGNKAVRMDTYKLVSDWDENGGDWELYDMKKDRTETHNIIEDYPEVANKMIAQYEEWADKNNVLNWNEIVEIRRKKRMEK